MARGKSGRFVKKGVKAKSEALAARNVARGVKNQLAKAAKEIVQEDVPMLVSCGRRLVEMDTLAKHLWCPACDHPLSLRNMEKETQFGCASILKVRCQECLLLQKVPTSKRVLSCSNGQGLFATNCKAALGCVDSGMGPEVLNKFLSCLNVLVLHQGTYKRAHDFISQFVVNAADESCKDAIEQERRFTLKLLLEKGITTPEGTVADFIAQHQDDFEEDDNMDPDKPSEIQDVTAPPSTDATPKKNSEVGITVKYDFGWNKRGNGFQYNSHSGRGSLFGQLTNQVLAYKTVSSYCRKCAMGGEPGDHACVRNHDGTAKAMEPSAAVDMCLKNPHFEEAQVRVQTIVADRDASTYAALVRESPHPISKLVDLNHNTKGFNNKLYELKKTFTWISTDIIAYFKRCLNNAIKQNKNSEENVKKAILNIAAHTYGQHDDCGDWCKAKSQPESYPFKNLPKMKPLSCPIFRGELEALLKEQADRANQIAACGSTQANESFNHMTVTRAPKSRHYAASNALNTRVAAAVLAKNVGADYTDTVYKSAHMSSPSSSKYRASIQRRVQYKRSYQALPHVKRRRLQLKMQDSWKEAKATESGGITYASGMGNVMERAVAATTAVTSENNINSWMPPTTPLLPSCAFVTVDLETSGFQAGADIIQIAATFGNQKFSAYMVPQCKIAPQASLVTGLKVVRGKLVHNNTALETKPPRFVASEFLAFLKNCGQQVVLVGHNLIRFDAPRILRFMKSFGEPLEFCSVVQGLVDTVPLIRQDKLAKLQLLADEFLITDEWVELKKNAHDALADCCILDGLLTHFNVSRDTLFKSVLTMSNFIKNQVFLRNKTLLTKDLSVFASGGVSKNMINKMAGAGVTMTELRSVMLEKGSVGFGPCLGVQIDGKPRVTTNNKIVANIAKFVRDAILAEGLQCPE